MLAADLAISEIFFRAPFAPNGEQQHEYIEVRGEPNSTIPVGTHLAVINGDPEDGWDYILGESIVKDPGMIFGFVDIGGVQLGANGYLVVRQPGQVDHPPIHPSAVEVTGQLPRFGNTTSMVLINSAVPLVDGTDVDQDDDGVFDTDGASWTLLDGVGYFPSDSATFRGYGKIFFGKFPGTPAIPVLPGITVVDTSNFTTNYFARTGGPGARANAEDWVTGKVQRNQFNNGWESDGAGVNLLETDHRYFQHQFDHLGTANFFSHVDGVVYDDANASGTFDAGDSGIPDVFVWADLNGNGVHDAVQYNVDPDDYPFDEELHDRFPAVTLSAANDINDIQTSFVVDSRTNTFNATTGTLVFSVLNSDQFSPGQKLRMDFHEPATSVSIDFFGVVPGDANGRLEVYDENGVMLDFVESGPVYPSIVDDIFETMTISRPQGDIAWAVAFAIDNGTINSGGLDHLRYSVMEPSDVTDADGNYAVKRISHHTTGTVPIRQGANTFNAGINGPTAYNRDFVYSTGSPPQPQGDAIAGRTPSGEWWVSRQQQSNVTTSKWATWSNGVNWQEIYTGDFNGDGVDDIMGQTSDYEFWVGRTEGDTFVTQYWGEFSPTVAWEDIMPADVDGDGDTDIVGRTNGQWWVAKSTGSGFTNEYWGRWSTAVQWNDPMIGDFNGDGRDDIAGRANGAWWLARSNGTAFVNDHWANWSTIANWENVMVGDFNGDDRDDIAARTSGQWWIAQSNGADFVTSYRTTWSTSVTWNDIAAGDFDGDGDEDIAGRVGGSWWIAESQGSTSTSVLWGGGWSPAVTWLDVAVADFDGDDKDDIIGRVGGDWWMAKSDGGQFTTSLFVRWSGAVNWMDARIGDFAG